ncbi:potassium transporter TrkG, partial [Sedimentibacter sp.]|uniref:potassium transporter TrkG n=1 Tax=Sedimentibacter sp. TaxID=1960295 RepID=UPI00289A32CE
LTLMFFGSCAGSTAGGIKSVRVLVLLKSVVYEIRRTIHPNSVQTIKIDTKSINDDTLKSILTFFFSYILIIIIAVILVSLDDFDFMTTFSSVLSMVSNIGPGFSLVGPMGNFADFSSFSKIVLSACMIFGRLEVIPVLILLSPANWKKH